MGDFGRRDMELLLSDTVDGKVYGAKDPTANDTITFQPSINPLKKVKIYRAKVKPEWAKEREVRALIICGL